MATIKVQFNVEGKWFTWMLRHLWVEGNEVKAIKVWIDTFPDHISLKSLNDYFIPIVSGKKKFTGWAAPDGFDIVKDNRHYWDPDQSGKDNHKSFPLLDSWKDVVLLKKTKLFVSELYLRQFQLYRRFPSTFEGCQSNAYLWIRAVEENKTENSIRKEVNKYWLDIRNISNQFAVEISLDMLPTDEIPLREGPTGKDKDSISSLQKCYSAYENIISYLMPVKVYFDRKYGPDHVYIYSDHEIRNLCSIEDDHDQLVQLVQFAQQSDMSSTALLSRLSIEKTLADVMGLSGVDLGVENFVKNMMMDSKRETINSEDIRKTKWQSGYIDLDGHFYGCSNLNHRYFADDLCKKFGFKTDDGQITLDDKGWVKVSMNRFFWKNSDRKLPEEQKVAIHDYMTGKKLMKAMFNTSLKDYAITFKEQFEQNEVEGV